MYGGAAGGGKSFALLMEPMRHINKPGFGGVIFRRTYPQITNEGGLWDESRTIYPHLRGNAVQTRLEWQFPSGASMRFAHMQFEADCENWQGAQIPYIAFDELTHFSKRQFLYVGLSRGRSTCGVRPYVRATCNPDPLSWVKEFWAPWLVKGHPQAAASGEVRWFVMDGGLMQWVPAGTPDAKSLTFIAASVYDNKILLEKNPEYLANLKALPLIDRKRLLEGDWDTVADGEFFKRHWFEIVPAAPASLRKVRFWDMAASAPREGTDPDWTVGILVGMEGGRFYILDVQRMRGTPGETEKLVAQTAKVDGKAVPIYMEQEPGSSGVTVIDQYTRRVLLGYTFRGHRSSGPKEERAKPVSAQSEAGNVKLVEAPWNGPLLDELSVFPVQGYHDDQVDALSGAMAMLTEHREIDWTFA